MIILALTLAFALAKDTMYLMQDTPILRGTDGSEVVLEHQQLSTFREDVIIYEDDFEGEIEWTHDEWWEINDAEYNSPTHSFNAPNPPGGVNAGTWKLYSPILTLPNLGDEEIMRFGFHLYIDHPDSDGDGDNSLEDLYRVSLADVDALAWHTTDFNAYDGDSYWCGDDDLGGYSDGWLQFLDSPAFTIPSTGYELSAMMKWALEDPCGGDCGVAGIFVDGWDACNVRISTDGGETFDVLIGSDPYDFTSGYGWVFNGEPEYIAGWGGQQDWHNVTFDLDDYAGEEVIIRFAFGSDPGFSTADDPTLLGLFVDNISVENAGGNQVFYADVDTEDPMTAAGLAWIEQFYDYGDDTRPGALGWEEYLPGYPYNGNAFLDISDFAGKNVQFRFQAVYDDNDDGGNGEGLFIDDFKVYIELGAPPAPTGLGGEALDSQCNLWWNDMNYAGTDDFVYDNDMMTQTITLTNEGEAWAGAEFAIVGPSTVNSISIFNNNVPGVPVTIAAFGQVGAFYNVTPIHEMEVVLGDGWNDFYPDWDITGAYLLAQSFTHEVGAALDESVYSDHSWTLLGGAWDTWENTVEGSGGALNHGEWGIRANITQDGANATYNVYRDGAQIGSGLNNASYTDLGVTNNVTYEYQVSATFPAGEESELSEILELTPQSNTVYEALNDDGTAEDGVNMGTSNYVAVRLTATGSTDELLRLKWYQVGDGGAFYIYLWEDGAGVPGTELYHHVVVGGVDGWNSYDMETEMLTLGGDFWVGIKEFTSTRPTGLDTDSDTGNSYYRIGETGPWDMISEGGYSGNLMLRAVLNGEEVQGCTLGDVNGDTNIDVLDIVQIVNFIMGSATPDDNEFCASDVNEDLTIDVLDIVQIVNIIMGN